MRIIGRAAYGAVVRFDLRTIDVGARDPVVVLNQIPGVTTRARCEGIGSLLTRHRHADLAYVAFRYPLPLRVQEFLTVQLGMLARIEDDAIYSRWPARNHECLEHLAAAARRYLSQQAQERVDRRRWPLAKLRTQLARQLARGERIDLGLCRDCEAIIGAPHAAVHRCLALLQLEPDQEVQWFAEFVAAPGNALDHDLISADGWKNLATRTRRGDFGATFHRRWLRYRAARLAGLTTTQIRATVAEARRRGLDVDFFYDATHAIFAWMD